MPPAVASEHRIPSRRAPSAITTTEPERRALEELAASITADPARDPVRFCEQAREAARLVPDSIAEPLRRFSERGSNEGVLLLDGLPTGPIPDTPLDNTFHLGEQTLLARLQAIVDCCAGNMVAYEIEGSGRIFQDLVPKPASADGQTSLSSRAELEGHTEQTFSALRPDLLSLACLRGDPEARTYVLGVQRIIDRLSAEEVAYAREPMWVTDIDESVRAAGYARDGEVRGPFPILGGDAGDPTLLVDQGLMRGVEPPAQRLLRKVSRIYLDNRLGIALRPGQILLIDNLRAVHGRSSFPARYDGTDRFVLRSFVMRDLSRVEGKLLPASVTVAARFS